MRIRALCASLAALLAATPAHAISDAELLGLVEQRLSGDRTGACFAVAVIAEQTARAISCADPTAIKARQLDADTPFEIGSVSKTMNGTLLAMLIAEGKLGLDDPLAKHLPAKTAVPEFDGKPITLRHLLVHTSGLPSLAPSWQLKDPANPYAALLEKDIIGALAGITLAQAPGEGFAYSNWGAMLLSLVVARTAGSDYESLIQQRLFAPLGMRTAFIDKPGKGVRRARGHLQTGASTPGWDFPRDTAGVGGVRASLNDMVRYVEAQLGRAEGGPAEAIRATHEVISSEPGRRMGMGWMMAPLNDREIFVHEGGTGGFSAFVAFDAKRSRGVVVLSDTALTAVGGLGSIGLHLLDPRVPLGQPRRLAQPDAGLVEALVGRYQLSGGMMMDVRAKGSGIEIQANGQPAFEMGYDSAGDFFPLAFDAVLRPSLREGQPASFLWMQGGGAVPASRFDPDAVKQVLSAEQLADYVGSYPLMPGFSLTVFAEGSTLKAQATGQGAFALDPSGQDVFSAAAFGIEIVFNRGAGGRVEGLALHQGGQTLRGQRDE